MQLKGLFTLCRECSFIPGTYTHQNVGVRDDDDDDEQLLLLMLWNRAWHNIMQYSI